MTDLSELLYSSDHEWLRKEGQEAVIGITAFAAGELGDIVYVDIPSEGAFGQGEVFGSIEAVKTVSDLFLPVSGEIIAVNPRLTDSPEIINSDPFGEGWLVRIRLKDEPELATLLSKEQYQKQTGHV